MGKIGDALCAFSCFQQTGMGLFFRGCRVPGKKMEIFLVLSNFYWSKTATWLIWKNKKLQNYKWHGANIWVIIAINLVLYIANESLSCIDYTFSNPLEPISSFYWLLCLSSSFDWVVVIAPGLDWEMLVSDLCPFNTSEYALL